MYNLNFNMSYSISFILILDTLKNVTIIQQ